MISQTYSWWGMKSRPSFVFRAPHWKIFFTLKNSIPQAILDLAHDLIQNNSRRLVDALAESNDQLVGEAKHPEKLAEVYEFKRPESEYFFLAEKASELIKAGASAKEIAIIYRDNQDAVGVTEILEKYGLPFRVESGNNALRDPAIRQFLEILRFVADPGS